MKIKALLFDIGGVVLPHVEPNVDPLEIHDQTWEARLNLEAGDIKRRIWSHENSELAVIGVLSFWDFTTWIASELGLSEDQLTDWNEDHWSLFTHDEDIAHWLQSLRPRYNVAFVSNALSDARGEMTRRFGLDELADLIVISAEEGVAKPQHGIYEVTLERLGMTAPDCVFIDDRVDNVEAAMALGMRGVICQSTQQMMADVNALLGPTAPDPHDHVLQSGRSRFRPGRQPSQSPR